MPKANTKFALNSPPTQNPKTPKPRERLLSD
jgi:hypothetical protein